MISLQIGSERILFGLLDGRGSELDIDSIHGEDAGEDAVSLDGVNGWVVEVER